MAYTTINKPSDYFNTVLFTGNGSTQSITGVGFQPDLVWGKSRTPNAFDHTLHDAVRGVNKFIISNSTSAEITATNSVTSFDSDGFSLGARNESNYSGDSYVAWNWLANGAGSSNTDGSITSTVSVNNTSGFSIVKYTGTGSAGNVGHGLSTAPKVLINKSLSGANDWFVGHSSIGFTKFLKLNEANAESTNSGIWNNTAPTTDHFTINSANGNTNATGVDYITYCFSEVKGFSKFGSYTGNGSSDGTFIYTGFKPAFVLIKKTSAIGNWLLIDNKRYNSAGNPVDKWLFADASDTEYDQASNPIDFYSNGLKMGSNGATINNSGVTYIYMAFAEHPLVSSTGTPCTAR